MSDSSVVEMCEIRFAFDRRYFRTIFDAEILLIPFDWNRSNKKEKEKKVEKIKFSVEYSRCRKNLLVDEVAKVLAHEVLPLF